MLWMIPICSFSHISSVFDRLKPVEMMRARTLNVLVALLVLSTSAAVEENKSGFCGKISLQGPFMDHSSSSTTSSSWLRDMILCRSKKLYLRTSIGLFAISSIDYSARTLTLVPDGPPSCSKSGTYISPALLTAGFPSQPNSLLLFNCRNQARPASYPIRNCPSTHSFKNIGAGDGWSCLLVDDIDKLGDGFHPKNLNCSHFLNVHRILSSEESVNEYEVGMKVSFEVEHKPDLCQECRRLNGRCGVGLKCFCHLAQCVDKVVSGSTASSHTQKIIIGSLMSSAVLIGFLLHMI